MKKKTLLIIGVIAIAVIVLLVAGKKAGWFGASGNVKEVESVSYTHLTLPTILRV